MLYKFGNCMLDSARCELHRDGELVPLEPKAYSVLLYLAEHSDRLVPRQELLDRVWPDVYVVDTTLARCLTLVRKAVGDSGANQLVIKTLHGQGYRFVAPLQIVEEPRPVLSSGAVESSPVEPPQHRAADGAGSTSSVVPLAPRDELKQVTALSGALFPAPALLHGVEPEALDALMATIRELVEGALLKFGGSLLQLRADGWDALFGLPRAQEDHARRAVLAALLLRERWAQEAPSWPQLGARRISLGLGLHSDTVLVRSANAEVPASPIVMSRICLLAERLARSTGGDALLVSAQSAALVTGVVTLGPAPALVLDEATPAREVFRVVARAAQHLTSSSQDARSSTPFVGRSAELRAIADQLDRTRAGQGRIVGITGAPGIGKSRLLAELCRALDPGVAVRFGRCQSYGQQTPYFALVDLLRNWWEIAETDADETLRSKVANGLESCRASAELTNDVLSVLGVQSSSAESAQPAQLRARAFGALHQLFVNAAELKPLLLIIEDLHWVDATTEHYLAGLAARLSNRALMLLATFRPGYRPPWQATSNYSQISLSPLAAEESYEIVLALGRGALSDTLSDRIIDRSQGNPFFLTSLTQAMLAKDGAASALHVPSTIQSVLSARIDRLSPEAKRLLQGAAVIGSQVPRTLLSALDALPTPAFESALAELETTELLYEARLAPESVYAFQHSLVEDVAYQSLLGADRRELHGRIFQVLEAALGEGAPNAIAGERLAFHSLRAENWVSAATYTEQAALRAFARGSNAEAAEYFEQAIHAVSKLPPSRATTERAIDLRLSLRSALLPSSDLERTLVCLREAEQMVREIGDSRRLAQISFFLSLQFYLQGEHAAAIEAGRNAQRLTEGAKDGVVNALATYLVGIPLQAQGRYREARDCFVRTLAALEGARRQQFFQLAILPAVTACAFHAVCSAELGDFGEARAKGEEGIEVANAVAHPPSQMFAAWGAGWACLRQGEAGLAIGHLERGLAICREAELALHFAMVAVPLGSAYLLAGRTDQALTLLRETAAHVTACKLINFEGVCGYTLAEALLAAGKLDEASSLAERALESARGRGEAGYEAYTLHVLGDIELQRGQTKTARERYVSSSRLAEKLEMGPLAARGQASLRGVDSSSRL